MYELKEKDISYTERMKDTTTLKNKITIFDLTLL